MLEKLGLPSKPSLRGSTWVVDASHCQGCSSQFTFINRKLYVNIFIYTKVETCTPKHHCRRCGGIFCGSCTQQRMVLRGQGDSPVRICEPCKKLEEAARFELRYGHKSRAAKEVATQVEGGDIVRNLSLNQPTADTLADIGSTTPEDLRQQAVVEKNKYRTLKAEGKSEEALKAFKRGKELERQAAALEITLRKNRKKALSSSSNISDTQQTQDDFRDKNKLPSKKSKETDDLSAELKDLGWSDLDLRDAEKKPATLSLEGELSSLIKEVSKKPDKEKATVSSDKSQVVALKKRALELKRAGNLADAKEELKRAKILERKIEEEELLGGADDSDDELSSLIRSMDGDEHDDLSAIHNKSDLNFNFDHFTGIADDLAVDGNFEVTDEDMDDPDIKSALKSLGWTEDNAHSEELGGQVASSDRESIATEIHSLKREAQNQKRASANEAGPKSAPKNKQMIQRELLALKRKAFSLRREGKLDESAEELKKAEALEEQLEDLNKAPPVTHQSIANLQNYNNMPTTLDKEDEEDVTDQDLHDPAYLSLLKNLGWEEETNAEIPSMTLDENSGSSKFTSESVVTQSVTNIEAGTSRKSKSEIQRELLTLKRKALTLRRQGEAEEADEVLKMAKLLEEKLHEPEKSTQTENSSESNSRVGDLERQVEDKVSLEKPDEIVHENEKPHFSFLQEEITAYKKKALALKRDGKLDEAKEALRQAKLLEKGKEDISQTTTNSSDASVSSVEKEASPSPVSKPMSSRERFKLQQESLNHKRQALKLRREGRTAEADSNSNWQKLLNPACKNRIIKILVNRQMMSLLRIFSILSFCRCCNRSDWMMAVVDLRAAALREQSRPNRTRMLTGKESNWLNELRRRK
ncbi:hypothetical protein DH2020_043349 [Rehmannia glutinosa]|uniref:FYVE-type domain-containing protein n=1 Tax=Rehmannia glutinosa TaxID=99300 RepID=A0ABR0UL38_REHGL